ncbi:MAG TPA: DUF5666 domain-containing protein [Patescibacteria group bacterium]|nr:DUF5666 domain-containing protein [Patescibacteria group bacterium]
MNLKIASFITLLLVFGLIVPSVSAQGPRQNLREERKNLMEQLREKMSSRAGAVKTFFEFGRAAIGGGEITAKTDTTLTVEKDDKSYTVNITEKTQLRRRFWGKATYDEFSVGNEVTVVGRWTDDTHTAINAVLIRNLSIQKRFGVFFGKVKSLLSNGWVMSTVSDKRADQTVTVSSETKFVNRRGETITQADVKVDHRVRVRGLWDRSLNTITEVKEVKDFNLPIVPTVTATP